MNKFDKTRVLLPKGEALEACTDACQANLGMEIPEFDGMTLSAETEGMSVFWLKPKDIPEQVARGLGDIGFVGTDVVMEYGKPELESKRASGERMCDFSFLALGEENREEFERLLTADQRGSRLTPIPTAMPRTLSRLASFEGLPFMPYGGEGFQISGSVEAYARLTGSIGVADLVQTGRTAEANGLIKVEKLFDVYPMQVERSEQ